MRLAVLGPRRHLTQEELGVEKLTNYGAPLTRVAPAILNAVFALTGQRIRTLPLVRAPVVPA